MKEQSLFTRKPIESPNQGSKRLIETELLNRTYTGLSEALCTYFTVVQLGLHVEVLTMEFGAVSDSVSSY